MELSKKNQIHLKDLVFHSEFQKGIQRKLESHKEKKRNEGFYITFRFPKGNSNLVQAEKEEKRKKVKKVGFYSINLHSRGIVSRRKWINDFRRLKQLHKSQTPLLALLREKTTNIEREKKRYLRHCLAEERKTETDFLLKEKKKKNISRDMVSKK